MSEGLKFGEMLNGEKSQYDQWASGELPAEYAKGMFLGYLKNVDPRIFHDVLKLIGVDLTKASSVMQIPPEQVLPKSWFQQTTEVMENLKAVNDLRRPVSASVARPSV